MEHHAAPGPPGPRDAERSFAAVDQRFYDAVLASPVIAAVKNMEQLEECLTLENIQVVFLLFGDL